MTSGTLDWIEDGEEPEHTEFRDDRFTAAIDRASDDKSVFTVAYIVRAVSPGKYVLPQAYVEDMYNPSRYGRTGTGIGRGASGEMSEKLHQQRSPSCPGKSAKRVFAQMTRASTSSLRRQQAKTWMAGTSPAMTVVAVGAAGFSGSRCRSPSCSSS